VSRSTLIGGFCNSEAKRIALNNNLKERFGYDALQEWNVKTEVIEAEVQLLNPTASTPRQQPVLQQN